MSTTTALAPTPIKEEEPTCGVALSEKKEPSKQEALPSCEIVASQSEVAMKQTAPAVCEICYDGFNKSTRKQVTCAYCSHSFCRGCVEQYVLSQGEQIVCPETACRMPWLEEFVDDQFTAVFRGGALRRHREKFVLDREKARLPELQERARRYKIALEGKECKGKIIEEASVEYLKVPEAAEDARLKVEYGDTRTHMYKADHMFYKYAAVYRSITTSENQTPKWEYAPKAGKEEQYAAAKLVLDEARKEYNKKYEEWSTYNAANEKTIEAAKKQYLTPARVQSRCPEFRRMIDSYGGPVRIWARGKEAIDTLKARLVGLYGEGAYLEEGAGDRVGTRRVVEIMRGCPADGCRGFLNSKWVCGVCDTAVCRHCHEIVDLEEEAVPGQCWLRDACSTQEGVPMPKSLQDVEPPTGRLWHRCSLPAVETARLLVKETKPCPTCRALISKVDGCDQMWCTQCQTAFSWITGQKEEGRIHNPHYYEWLRRTAGAVPREVGDVPGAGGAAGDCCADENRLLNMPWLVVNDIVGGAFDNYFTDIADIEANFTATGLTEFVDKYRAAIASNPDAFGLLAKKAMAELLLGLHRRVLEVYQYDVANRRNWYDNHADTQGLENAIDFLVGRIDEADWLKRVWSRDRMRRYRNDVKEIKRMFYAAGRDMLNSFVLGRGSIKAGETVRGFVVLFDYANAAIIKAQKRYCLTSSQDMTLASANLSSYCGVSEKLFMTLTGKPLDYKDESSKTLNQIAYGLMGAKLPSGWDK